MQKFVLLLIGVVIGAAVGVSYVRIQSAQPPAVVVVKQQTVKTMPPAVTGDPIGGAFELVDHNGETVTQDSWGEKYTLVFFGFTHCPEICPSAMQKAGEVLELLGEDADKLQVLLVTVDPARDTVEQMAEYMTQFDSRIVGLTGTQDQIDAVSKAYKVYAKKVEMGEGMYMMDHSAYFYLMSPDDTMAAMFRHKDPAVQIVEKTREILNAEKEDNAG